MKISKSAMALFFGAAMTVGAPAAMFVSVMGASTALADASMDVNDWGGDGASSGSNDGGGSSPGVSSEETDVQETCSDVTDEVSTNASRC